jgi:hypothetical protein
VKIFTVSPHRHHNPFEAFSLVVGTMPSASDAGSAKGGKVSIVHTLKFSR